MLDSSRPVMASVRRTPLVDAAAALIALAAIAAVSPNLDVEVGEHAVDGLGFAMIAVACGSIALWRSLPEATLVLTVAAPALTDLRALVDGFAQHDVDVLLDLTGDLSEHTPDVRAATYRVVQESLTNVLRHAGATRVQVEVTCDDHGVEVEVTDDGCGRHNAPPGHGLLGMRERVEALAGTLDARDGDAGGFVVRARLPVPT